MVAIIRGVDRLSEPNTFRVYWETPIEFGSFRVYAKDELDAYAKGTLALEEKDKAMKYFIIAAAAVISVLILAITIVSIYDRVVYAQNMQACVAADKSYVSENDGYSCRTGTPPKVRVAK